MNILTMGRVVGCENMVMHEVEKMTWKEFEKIVEKKPIAVIPVGVLEEHGPHLPLGSDTMQAIQVCKLLAENYEKDVLVYPPINYGVCMSTRNFPGSLTLRYETMKSLIKDIIKEIYRAGVKKIIVLSGHAGSIHLSSLKDAAHECIHEFSDINLMVLSDYEIIRELSGKMFDERDGHSGTIETSRIMLIDESLVKGRPDASFERPPKFHILRNPEKYFPSGIIGDPTSASSDKGREINKYIVKKLIEEIKNWED